MNNLYFRNDLNLENPVKEVFTNFKGQKVSKKTCSKCDGTGFIPEFGFSDNGKCWRCRNKGYEVFRIYTAKEIKSIIKANDRKIIAGIKKTQLNMEITAIQRMKRNHEIYVKNVAYKKAKILQKNKSKYIGNAGDKLERLLTLDWCIEKEGNYGNYYIKQLRDNDGNIFSHMGSALRDADYKKLPKGSTFTLKFTVKEHSEYKGLKQTKITNPRLVKGE